jgi:hypothetical protein
MPVTVYPADGYDSFVSLEGADAYLASVGYVDWVGAPQGTREASLRRGTQYIYSRKIRTEFLSPAVHGNIAAATAEAAYRDFKGQLYRDVQPQAVKQKTVGPISITYGDPVNAGQIKFPVIEDLLFGMTYSSGFGPVYLERA